MSPDTLKIFADEASHHHRSKSLSGQEALCAKAPRQEHTWSGQEAEKRPEGSDEKGRCMFIEAAAAQGQRTGQLAQRLCL